MKRKTTPGLKIICLNRKASFNYFFEDLLEAGIVLKGSEIKSIRNGKVNIADAYAIEKNGELVLINSHIASYKQASYSNHKPMDERKLLLNKRGGVGAISVTANIAPKLCSEFQRLSVMSDSQSLSDAKKLNDILQPLHHSMFVESNPSPVKYAAKLLNLCEDEVRLPLVKVTDPTKQIIKKALLSAKLI